MKPLSPRFRHLCGPVLVILVAYLAGCSTGNPPTATSPSDGAPEVLAPGIRLPAGAAIAISARPLTKPAGTPQVKEKGIGPRGGRLTVINGRSLVHFKVPRGALVQDKLIRMEVTGSGPSTQVRLGPAGLQFPKSCTLVITFSRGDTDPEDLGGYLIGEDGTATPVSSTVQVLGDWVIVKFAIDHFSIYAPDDGEEDGAGDDPL